MTTYLIKLESVKFDDQHGMGNNIECPAILSANGLNVINSNGLPANFQLINNNNIRPIQYSLTNNQYIDDTNNQQIFRTTNGQNLQFLNTGSNVYNIVNLDQLQSIQLSNPMTLQSPIEINGDHFLQQQQHEPLQQIVLQAEPQIKVIEQMPQQPLQQQQQQPQQQQKQAQQPQLQTVNIKSVNQTPEIESAVNICQKIKIDQRKLNKYVRIRFREIFGPKFLIDHDLQQCDKSKMDLLKEEALSLFKPRDATERSAWARAKQSLRLMRNAMLKN